MSRDVIVGWNHDGTPVLDPFERYAEARAAQLQADIRVYVDGIASPDAREMLLADLFKKERGKPFDPSRVAIAEAVEAFTDRARAEGDRIAAACFACADVAALEGVDVDFAAIGVP